MSHPVTGPLDSAQPSPSGVQLVAEPAGAAAPFRLARAARYLLVGAWGVMAILHLAEPPATRLQTFHASYLLLEVLACGSLALRAFRTAGPGRLAWWLLTASAFLEIPNLLIQALLHHGYLPVWTGQVTSYFSLGTGILVLAGVLSFPRGREQGGSFLRRILDSLIFAVALLFLLWVMGLQGSLHAQARGMGLRAFADYLNVACLGGGLVFMTSYQPERARGPLGWLAASACVWLVGISCWTLTGLPSVIAADGWVVIVGAIPLFQGLAAWSPRSVEEVLDTPVPERNGTRWLPYLPASLAVLVLALVLFRAPLALARGAFGIFLIMVVLLLLRQFQAIEDLHAARRTLEARVLHRTEALEQAQDMLLRTERMNSAALIGAGLAHDLNNLMGVIHASAELASLAHESDSKAMQKDLDHISAAADQAAQLTKRMMAFVRREPEPLGPLDLGRVVRGMEATLGMMLPRSIRLRIEVANGEPLLVHSSPLRIEQMVVNLVANARDAMPGGGSLSVHVMTCQGDGAMALLEVRDTGAGMAPEVEARIFEPFFTTKVQGKGTGLGLPSLKAMVEEAGGRLEVESALGQGSRFSLLLPRVDAARTA